MAFLANAEAALLKRHEVIHSLSPFAEPSQVRGWRNVPKSLLTSLVGLVNRCRQAELWVRPPAP